MGASGKGNGSIGQKLLDPGGYVWDQSGPLPEAPDFMKAAEREGASTRPNQTNPFATSTWKIDPATGQYTQNVALAGGLGDAANTLSARIGESAGAPLPTGEQAREQAISSAYSQAMSRLRPEWDRRENQLRSRLAAQGLSPDTEAARSELDSFSRSRNDAETGAMASAIDRGAEAGNAIFQQGLQSSQVPYQQIGALKDLSSGFASGTNADPYAAAVGAKYMGDVETYNAKAAGKNAKTSGAASGVGAIASMF